MVVEMAVAVGIVAVLATGVADPIVYLAVEVGTVARAADPIAAARPIEVADPIAAAVQVAMVVDTDSLLNPFYLTQVNIQEMDKR